MSAALAPSQIWLAVAQQLHALNRLQRGIEANALVDPVNLAVRSIARASGDREDLVVERTISRRRGGTLVAS
jgi:hypothetical protein